MDPLVIVFGLGVGILVGLTGIGGGSLMTPLLLIFIGTNPVVAVGTDLAYGAVTKTVGGWRHLRSGTVDLGVSKWLAFGSVPASVGGVLAGSAIAKGADEALLWTVAGALLLVAFVTLARALFMPALVSRERHEVALDTPTKAIAIGIGAVLGFVLGVTSVGSGALVGLALILVFRLFPHRVVGTDVFHAALMLWAAGLTQVVLGHVDYGLMATILVGSLPGVVIGERLVHRVPSAVLRPALGCVLLGSALGVMSKAGLELEAWQIVGPPVVAGVLAFCIDRSRRVRLSREAVAAHA
ncbi:MAG TPA: sulfite exporter TauE/SafE family protein [Solirubrobacteraceae bacterium]|nr:sulfite exporter TauE/SafE family protein [Solirubrobacteraceae bacterium]